jgi:hypothetical protein
MRRDTLLKQEKKIFLVYKEVQKQKRSGAKSRLTAFLYVTKYLRISSYFRKPFLIYDFAPHPFLNFLIYQDFFKSVCSVQSLLLAKTLKIVHHGIRVSKKATLSAAVDVQLQATIIYMRASACNIMSVLAGGGGDQRQ